MPELFDQHRFLARMIGSWRHRSTCDGGPDGAPQVTTGTEDVRAFGAFWIVADGTFDAPAEVEGTGAGGGTMATRMTLGYDPRAERFIGTWIGSAGTAMFVYAGTLRADGRTLVLETEGVDFREPARTARYRDEIEIVSDAARTLRSHVLERDGTWHRMLESVYERTG